MTRIQLRKTSIILGLTLTFAVSPALGQTATATISGRVVDSGGAVIAGAVVELASIERGTVRSVPTNGVGIYVFPSVEPGHYNMTAKQEGFKKADVHDLQVEVGSQLEQNLQLEIGSVRDSVTVETAEPLVNTISATLSSVVTGATIQDLPLNGRDTLQLALTAPGVTPNPGTGNTFSIAGARASSITFMYDGGVNTGVALGGAVIDPNPDTVAEFRILTNNYSAEYGRSNGGIVSVVSKTGTNGIHGTLFDYLRNKDFNANNFFNQSDGPANYSPVPTLIRNQFGGTVGGPLTIPKLINGKDRFFWFFSYQGQRQNSTVVGPQVSTFTPAELNGDFSHAANGVPDPGVAAFLQSHPYFQPNPNLAAQAIISPASFDPVAQAIIKNERIPTSPSGILTPNGTAQDNRDEFSLRTDFNINQNQRLAVSLASFRNGQLLPFQETNGVATPGGQPNIPGFPSLSVFNRYFGGITFTSVITPSLLNEAHFNVQRLLNGGGQPAGSLPTPSSLGMNIRSDINNGPPLIQFLQSGLNLGEVASYPGQWADTTYSWTDSLNWTRGNHNLKIGGGANVIQNNGQFAWQANGVFDFSGPAGIGTGLDLADFLIGAPDYYYQSANSFNAVRGHQYSLFGQDEWKVRPNLTLTLGLRYEYNQPKWDPLKRNPMFIFGDQSATYPLMPEGTVFPCDPKAPCPGTYFPDRTDFAPRVGVAWDPFKNGKTSIRGGFGVFYDVINGADNLWSNGTPPFVSYGYAYPGEGNWPGGPSGIPNGQLGILTDPYAVAGIINPFPSRFPNKSFDPVASGLIPFTAVYIDPHEKTPYTYAWNVTIQHSLGGGVAVEAAYVGSSSHRQIVSMDPNSFIRGTTMRPWNTQPGLQYPDAYSVGEAGTSEAIGSSNYNGLVASVTKRMGDTHGFGQTFFTLGYTFGKVLSDQDTFTGPGTEDISAYNVHQFYAPGAYDVTHRIVFSGGWQLPFDHLWSSGPKRLTTGWSLFPILSWQTGFPVDFKAGLPPDPTVPGPAGDGRQDQLVHPDWVSGSEQMLDPHAVETYTVNGQQITGHFFFNPSGFLVPACFHSSAPPGTPGGCPVATYGSLQRNTFRGPNLTNLDLSLEKKTNLNGERVQLLFRAEFFNVLNHTEFVAPLNPVSVRSALVGQITSTRDPRIGQLALKVVF